MFRRRKEFNRDANDLTFGRPPRGGAVSWFITGLAIILVVGLGAFLYFSATSDDTEDTILLTDQYAAVTPAASPTVEELAATAPAAGMPDRSVLQEPVQGEAEQDAAAERPQANVSIAASRSLAVVDVDGRIVGPVTRIDPEAGADQEITFALEPGLSELFNYNEDFRMPLDDLAVVVDRQGDYALQLDEGQTRFLAAYLLGETSSVTGRRRGSGSEENTVSVPRPQSQAQAQ